MVRTFCWWLMVLRAFHDTIFSCFVAKFQRSCRNIPCISNRFSSSSVLIVVRFCFLQKLYRVCTVFHIPKMLAIISVSILVCRMRGWFQISQCAGVRHRYVSRLEFTRGSRVYQVFHFEIRLFCNHYMLYVGSFKAQILLEINWYICNVESKEWGYSKMFGQDFLRLADWVCGFFQLWFTVQHLHKHGP